MQFKRVLWITVLGVLLFPSVSWAGPERADLEGVAKSLSGVPVREGARYFAAEDRYLRFMGAAPGTVFRPRAAVKSGDAEQAARAYLAEHMKAFGETSAALGFTRDRVLTSGGRSYVRLNQTYNGLPVFGAQISVQVAADGGIECVLSDIMRDTRLLDTAKVLTTPTVSADAAGQAAVRHVQALHPGVALQAEGGSTLQIYHPAVVGNAGPTSLVWVVTVSSPATETVRELVLVDARTGTVVFGYSLVHTGLFRRIFDAYQGFDEIGFIRRQEGQGLSGIPDVDNAYDYLGDTYNFYFNEHSRDSIDGFGLRLDATVRLNVDNAYWTGTRMLFGNGYVADDVTAHELTHGVTQWTSNLIYANESGAINEAFSDIWGEYVDLTNGRGNDGPSARWLMGEDMPGGALRNMKDPQEFIYGFYYRMPDRWPWIIVTPDRYSRYIDTELIDYGGVHINSGIGNKLCYLMTDGDSFNGYTVQGIGISRAADLFYEVQNHLLTMASDYYDLGAALVQAVYNLNYTVTEIRDVETATRAVEIAPPDPPHPLRHLRAVSPQGQAQVRLTWDGASWGDFGELTLVRRTDRFAQSRTDTQPGNEWAKAVNGHSYTDTEATLGAEYFYALFHTAGGDLVGQDFARVVVGEGEPDYFSESFAKGAGRPVDLAYTQFTFDPMIDLTKAHASGQPRGYANYGNYVVSVRKNVNNLPVDRDGATYVTLGDDVFVPFTARAPIPFFGRMTTNFALSSNGFVADLSDMVELYAAADLYHDTLTGQYNFPSLPSHFDFPKISFLFADLSPHSGGTVWGKDMPDRFVITFEQVPEFGAYRTNTAQLEMFYSGRIRITLLEVHADNAIVGLSDGKGLPVDPDTDLIVQSNLSDLPTLPAETLTLAPVPPQRGLERLELSFALGVETPVSGPDPKFTFERVDATGMPMPLPQGVTLTPPSGAGTRSAVFTWTPTLAQGGYYTFRATFALGAQEVSQDIQVIIGDDPNMKPVATNVRIVPANPQDSEVLKLEYTYSHEEAAAEGHTLIRWFKNGMLIPALTDRREVPSEMTREGENWWAVVTPATVAGVQGAKVQSAIVTIERDTQPDINRDGRVNAMDVQLVVNAALGQGPRTLNADVDGDYLVNAMDVQYVVNRALMRPLMR